MGRGLFTANPVSIACTTVNPEGFLPFHSIKHRPTSKVCKLQAPTSTKKKKSERCSSLFRLKSREICEIHFKWLYYIFVSNGEICQLPRVCELFKSVSSFYCKSYHGTFDDYTNKQHYQKWILIRYFALFLFLKLALPMIYPSPSFLARYSAQWWVMHTSLSLTHTP